MRVTVEGAIKYLDMSVYFQEVYLHWILAPGSKKSLFSFSPALSKIVKFVAAVNVALPGYRKYSERKMTTSFRLVWDV